MTSKVNLWRSNTRNRRSITVAVSVVLIVIIIFSIFCIYALSPKPNEPEVFVGIDVGFGDENEVYKVADAVEGYANLMIIGSLEVTNDSQRLLRVCDYLYDRGFYFIVYVGFARGGYFPPQGPDAKFFDSVAGRYNDKLLGVYMFDELGGKQIDYEVSRADKIVPRADNYSDAAIHFIFNVNSYSSLYPNVFYASSRLRRFTSDYALYWYDYLAGYNVIFGEFVGNQSRQLAVSLTRGAARETNERWGTMITWKYDQPPYLEEADQLLDDMILAYENGAKYILVFNGPGKNPPVTELGILTQEHLKAIEDFWNYAKNNPRGTLYSASNAYVLPPDYGYGFRGPNDSVWGLWPPDVLSAMIWNEVNSLIDDLGKNLDVVYTTRTHDVPTYQRYNQMIYWNGTIRK